MTPDDVIPVLITPFSYACSGSEDSLNQCLVTMPTCNLDSADDIVALECGNPTEIEVYNKNILGSPKSNL